jgi:serine phosphatase RsbU (regulator of sigma subunit)
VFCLSDTHVVLVIGDVVGHDTPAAIGMSRLRYLINAFAVEAALDSRDGRVDPHAIFSRIDRLIQDDASAWATCVIAIVDTVSHEMRWSSAGHPAPIVVRDGSVRHLDDDLGGMLGVAPARRRGTASLPLFEGDRVLLYTDGLFERRRESIDIGLTRLLDTVRACQGRPLSRFCDDLITAMFARTRQTDDMALLAIDVSPAAATNGTRG